MTTRADRLKSIRIKPEPVTLRVLGTSVTLLDSIRQRAHEDLGIRLEFTVMDGVEAQRVGVMAPDTFDIYDQWFHNVNMVWPAGSVQPIETNRIKRWAEINDLPKKGRLTPLAPIGSGCAPVNCLYVQPDGHLGSRSSEQISMLPVSHNADSFGYRIDALPEELDQEHESWSWLLDERFCGRVGLQNDCAIGAIDAALAAQAAGLVRFRDIGNLTVSEIDDLIRCLIRLKKHGHFAAFWGNYDEAATQMIQGRVAIESLWSPALTSLKRKHVNVRIAAPAEGYRAWYGGMAISRMASGRTLDACYEYMNWWLDGWPGSVVARQGYYISVPERARYHMTVAEWDYWYGGKPAAHDLLGIDGEPLVSQGHRREGGNYSSRMSKIAVWNSVMDEHNYLMRRWNDFMAA